MVILTLEVIRMHIMSVIYYRLFKYQLFLQDLGITLKMWKLQSKNAIYLIKCLELRLKIIYWTANL